MEKRIITDIEEVKKILNEVEREWTLQEDNEEPIYFAMTTSDIQDIIDSIEQIYEWRIFYFKPVVELHDDGNVSVIYPSVIVRSLGLKKDIKLKVGKYYKIKNAPRDLDYSQFVIGQRVKVIGEENQYGRYPIDVEDDRPLWIQKELFEELDEKRVEQ